MHTDHYFYVGTENEQGQNTVFETDSDKSGKITAIEDKVGNYHRYYTYDFLDRLSKRSTVKTGLTIESQFTYDYNERPLSKNVLINNVSTDQTTIHYKSDIDDTVSYITHTAVGNENFTYDALKRVNSYKLAMPGMEKAVVYAQKGERTSDRIKKETTVLNNVVDNTISYGYNNNKGNLTEVFVDNELINRYFYDGFGRIIREDNRKLSFTKLYFYDENGNILERREYAFTLGSVENASYTSVMYGYRYDKGDRLQSYAGESCTYNAMGYPTVYRSKTLTWSMVKHLASFDDVTYTYDYQGVRMTKTADNVTHNYLTDDGKLIEERFGENTLKYYYGAQGILGFDYNGTKYFYVKNMLGDVIALVDASGIVVARYAYDAWGNHKVFNPDGTENTSASFIGNVNPIRYRGYYFDEETGLYYLKTRYYDPQVGRFISPDSIEYLAPSSVSGLNLYAYCNNNPVMYTDESGEGILTAILIGALIGVIIGGTISGISAANSGETGWDLVGSIAQGALIGGGIGAIGGAFVGAIPTIGSFMGSTFTFSGGAMAISVSGAQVATGAATALGVVIMLSKGSGPRFGHNQHEKQMYEEALRRTGVTDRALRQRIHRKLGNYPYQDTLKGLIDVIEKILQEFSR